MKNLNKEGRQISRAIDLLKRKIWTLEHNKTRTKEQYKRYIDYKIKIKNLSILKEKVGYYG